MSESRLLKGKQMPEAIEKSIYQQNTDEALSLFIKGGEPWPWHVDIMFRL